MSVAFKSGDVTVIIPSKDGTETIERALDSLIASADHIAEVFIVHSNSPQHYVDFCRSLPCRYQQFFTVRLGDSGHPSNGSIARNWPLPFAAGRYIALLDDDDEWLPGKLDAYFKYLDDRKIDGDFVLFSTVIGCDEDRSNQHLLPSRAYHDEPIADFILSFGGGAQTSALMLPTDLMHRVSFDPRLARHQDYDFCMRLYDAGASFHHIAVPLSYWYQRGSSAAKGGTFEFCASWLDANRHRLSNRAVAAYVGKEMFAAARASGDWRSFVRFATVKLDLKQLFALSRDLLGRTMSAILRRAAGFRTEARY